MSLAGVLLPSPTKNGWKEWSFHNFQHHQGINLVLQQERGIVSPFYRLWPVGDKDFQDWLAQHQYAHNFFNSALGLAGQDLSSLDLKDRTKRDDWFEVHFLEHLAVAQTLGTVIL
jgi:hypothetical protein